MKLERITFTANGRNDHVIMFILHLPLTVFSFSVKSSRLALASKVRIILHYSCLCTNFSEENINANLTSAVCRKRDSKSHAITEQSTNAEFATNQTGPRRKKG